MLDGLAQLARKTRSPLLRVNDIPDADASLAEPALWARGCARLVSPPLAFLHLPFASFDAFYRGLSTGRRDGLRRNLRRAEAVDVEIDADISGLEGELAELADGFALACHRCDLLLERRTDRLVD